MRKQFLVPALVGILALGAAAQAFAQSATVVMRSGERVQAEVYDMGAEFTFIVGGNKRTVPIGDVALIDFSGGASNIPAQEISRANAASEGFVVMRSGEQFPAKLYDIRGVPTQAEFVGGRMERLSDISRIYLGPVRNVAGLTTPTPAPTSGAAPREDSQAPAHARQVVVPSNVQWTDTGLNVRRGQRLRIEPSGEVSLSFNEGDIARPAGALSNRRAPRAPIPTIPAGALIGRIGNGQPFPIGDTTEVFDIPANGRLLLGINDDHVTDNSGNYVVRIWEP